MKPKRGDIVEVRFDDHTLNGDKVTGCTAYGRVHSFTKRKLTIDCWHLSKGSDRTPVDDTECFTILRAAITGIWRLKRA